MPVNTAPASTPSRGLLKAVSMRLNSGISASGSTAPPIISMPYISTAKPTKMEPMSLYFCRRAAIIIIIPASASTSEKFSGLRSFSHGASPSMPVMLSSHAVMVVPMFEPIITPMVRPKCIMPELTRPTSITVTAEDD